MSTVTGTGGVSLAKHDAPVPGAVSSTSPSREGDALAASLPPTGSGSGSMPPIWHEPGPVPLGRVPEHLEVRRDYELDAGVDYDEPTIEPEQWDAWGWSE